MRRRSLFICFRLPNGQPRRTNMAALIACRDYLEEKLLVQQSSRQPIIPALQPIRINVAINIPGGQPEGCLPCFPHRLKHCSRVKDWLIPNKPVEVRNGTLSLMMENSRCNQMRQVTII